MENILKIGDKVKGFEYAGKYGGTGYRPTSMDKYDGVIGTVTEISPSFNKDIVKIDFGDDFFWYPKDEALDHKVEAPIDCSGRVYTEATPLLKEIWRLYGGKKGGSCRVEESTFFDNCDQDENSGYLYASLGSDSFYIVTENNYKRLTEKEFIDFMEFEQELIDKAESNLINVSPATDHQIVVKTEDVVNSPSHYTDGKIEVIDFIEDKGLGFHLGNCVKYVSRAGKKDPNKTKEDLNKAIWYIKRYIDIYLTDDEKTTDNL